MRVVVVIVIVVEGGGGGGEAGEKEVSKGRVGEKGAEDWATWATRQWASKESASGVGDQ